MYVPKPFEMKKLTEQHKFIEEFSFGIMVSTDNNSASSHKFQATHLPFTLNSNEGQYGTLYTHCARANPHWRIVEGANVLVTFSGPHSYISPNWYQAGPAVPTWNYASVHIYGQVELLNQDQTLWAVEQVVKQYEPSLLNSGSVMTSEYRKKLLAAIVGFKVVVSRTEGQQKLGQQRNTEDQKGVYAGLSKSGRIESVALANYMSKYNLGMGVLD